MYSGLNQLIIMQLFYATNREKDLIVLEDQEAKHCVQVLRKKVGDEIMVTDGQGNLFTTELVTTSKSRCQLAIQETHRFPPHRPYLHIGIVPTKNIDRVEWFLEKATELGINEISLLLSENSERKKLRYDRLQKLLIAAMKQSLNTHLPRLNDLQSYQDWVDLQSKDESPFKLIPHIHEQEKQLLKDAYRPGQNVTVLIGPEGGFAKSEVDYALNNGFTPVSLGDTRLRTETAAIAVCAFINFMKDT